MTSAMRSDPPSLRHFALADKISLKTMASAVFRDRQPFVFFVRCRTVAKVLAMIGRANVFPVLSREIVEG